MPSHALITRGDELESVTGLALAPNEDRAMQTLFTSKEVAELLHCECRTVEDHLRSGNLPGVKIGPGWIIPSEALHQRLNQLALEEAEKRRSGRHSRPLAIQMKPPDPNRGRRRGPPKLPQL